MLYLNILCDHSPLDVLFCFLFFVFFFKFIIIIIIILGFALHNIHAFHDRLFCYSFKKKKKGNEGKMCFVVSLLDL